MSKKDMADAGRSRQGVANQPRSGALSVHAPAERVRMEATCLIDDVQTLAQNLSHRVVGQDEVLESLICSFARLLSGLRDPSRPLLTALLLGPTGVGKTETVKALAQTLFGSERAMMRVNCEEYAHGHELAKLLGSPPGYVGYDIEPLLTQARIDQPHKKLFETPMVKPSEGLGLAKKIFATEEGKYLSVVLFDEIEKAHPIVWNMLLGILEDGMLTLGDNSTTDFTRSIILMTSNVGSRDMDEFLERRPVGFHTESDTSASDADTIRELALAAARRELPLEFLNRFDEILVYSALEYEHLGPIFDKFLGDIHDRALKQAGIPLLIKVSQQAKSLIIERGTDLRFGARPLRRAMERELVDPISRLIASQKLHAGDVVEVETDSHELVFYRNSRISEEVIA